MTLSLLDFQSKVPNQSAPRLDWDWTSAFNALMAADDISVVIPPGVYYMRYPVKITKKKDVFALGAVSNALGIITVSSDFFRLTGLTMSGNVINGPWTNTEHNIILEDASNVLIEHCTFASGRKNAIQFSNNGSCSNVRIESCTFNNMGGPSCAFSTEGMCVYVQNAEKVKVRDCDMRQIYGQSAIFVCRSSDIKIQDSIIEYTRFRGIQTFSMSNSTDETDVVNRMVVDNVTIRYVGHLNQDPTSEAMNGIFIRNNRGKAWDVKITRCTIEYCGENCLEGTFEAYDNTLRYPGYYPRFTTTEAKNAAFLHSNSTFSNNTVEGAAKEGVKVFWSRKNIHIQGNLFIDCGMAAVSVHAHGETERIEGVNILDNTIRRRNTSIPAIEMLATSGGTLFEVIEDRNLIIDHI